MDIKNEYLAEVPRALLTPKKIILSFVGLYLIYAVSRTIYNVYFHPLAKYPGPKLWAASSIPYFRGVLNGEESAYMKKLHDQYGPSVRIRPNALSYNSAQAWKDIYGARPGKKQIPRDKEYYFGDGDGVPDIIVSNDTDHNRIRKLLSYAFSEQAMREQEPLITQYMTMLISKLHNEIRGPTHGRVDIAKWYNLTTFDVVADLCFGESFHALESGVQHPWVSNIFKGVKLARFLRLARAFPSFGAVLMFIVSFIPAVVKGARTHRMYTIQRTEKRLAMKTNRKDFMSYVLRHNDEKGMTREEIKKTSGLLIIAATLLSGTTFYLLKNKDIYEKVTKEVRTSFNHEDDINFLSVSKLPYLNAVLEEGLRLYPPVPSAFPRRVAVGGDVIDGQLVPGGTSVGVNQWAANQSAGHFRDPEKFIPERWLNDERYAGDDKEARQPFSLGPRNCIGKNLAYAEMRSIMARMLWNFDMQLCEDSEGWNDQRIFILWDKPELHIRLSARRIL
ncbi:hypothetical protein MMC26_002010 [Xylographa opegraphella]|nr:hypothetical protein [Xylographa opegraphella]